MERHGRGLEHSFHEQLYIARNTNGLGIGATEEFPCSVGEGQFLCYRSN